jgi:Tfp pilus assembly protein PilE
MRLPRENKAATRSALRGITLIELLIYIAILGIVLDLAWNAFYRAYDHSRCLQNAASDISRALNAGERWREDARASSGFAISNQSLTLTQVAGVVCYTFESNAVYRSAGSNSIRVLNDVKDSRMLRDDYGAVAALRWELELATTRSNPPSRPVFTFKAVPHPPKRPSNP